MVKSRCLFGVLVCMCSLVCAGVFEGFVFLLSIEPRLSQQFLQVVIAFEKDTLASEVDLFRNPICSCFSNVTLLRSTTIQFVSQPDSLKFRVSL